MGNPGTQANPSAPPRRAGPFLPAGYCLPRVNSGPGCLYHGGPASLSGEVKVDIKIDMDRPCKKCGRKGATQYGVCLKCVQKYMLAKLKTGKPK